MGFGGRASSSPSCAVGTLLRLTTSAGRMSLIARTPIGTSLGISVSGSSSGPEIIAFVLLGLTAQGCIVACAVAVIALFACCRAVTYGVFVSIFVTLMVIASRCIDEVVAVTAESVVSSV